MYEKRHRPLSNANKRKAGARTSSNTAQMSYFDTFELPSLLVEDAISRFIAIKRAENLRKMTINLYQKTLRYFAEWLESNCSDVIYINQITRRIIEDFVAYSIDEKKLSPNTVNSRIRVLRTLFNVLIDDGEATNNPASKIVLLKTDATKIRVYTDDQINRILAHCDSRSYVGFRDTTFIILALDTGMRVSETLALKVQDIDFESRTISIDGEIAKSRRSRIVPFSAYTSKQLRELVEENKYHFPDSTHLFLSIAGKPMNASGLRKRLHDIGSRSGVSSEIEVSPHSFRHTAATTMLKNGMDLYSLSRILGHSTLEMTKRYLALTPKELSVRHDRYSPIQQFRTRKRRF